MASTYDEAASSEAVTRAARQASECAKINADGPFGDFTVQVVIRNNGKFDAQLPGPLAGASIGKCVENAFEHEMVPPWEGPDHKAEAKVSLVKPPEAPKPKKTGVVRRVRKGEPVRQGETVVEGASDSPPANP